jgi:two-component system, response regulator PdtaR
MTGSSKHESALGSLRIVVADDDADMREYYRKVLARLGHEVVATAADGRELVEHCRAQRPDLVITDVRMPELNGIEAARQIYETAPVPVILVSAHHYQDLLDHTDADHILAYLVKPISPSDLEPAIAIAMRQFEQFQMLRQEAADLRQALADRKLIERAKGLLMKRAGLDEQAAFRRLQKLASDHNQKLADIAEALIVAEDAFAP